MFTTKYPSTPAGFVCVCPGPQDSGAAMVTSSSTLYPKSDNFTIVAGLFLNAPTMWSLEPIIASKPSIPIKESNIPLALVCTSDTGISLYASL